MSIVLTGEYSRNLDVLLNSLTARNIVSFGEINAQSSDLSDLLVSDSTELRNQILMKPVQFSVVGESMGQYDASYNLLYQLPMSAPSAVGQVLGAIDLENGQTGWISVGGGSGDVFTNTDGNVHITSASNVITINLQRDLSCNNMVVNGTLTAPNLMTSVVGTANEINVNTASGVATLSFPSGNNALIVPNNIITNGNAYANTSIGYSVLNGNTGGSCTGVGSQCLNSTTTANNETGAGVACLNRDVSGVCNSAYGSGSLYWMTGGQYNSALGYNSGSNCLGNHNTFLGANAGTSSGLYDCSNCIFIGANSSNPTSKTDGICVIGDSNVNTLILGSGNFNFNETVSGGLYLSGYSLPTSAGVNNEILACTPSSTSAFKTLNNLLSSSNSTIAISNATDNTANITISNSNLANQFESTNSTVSIAYDSSSNKINLTSSGSGGSVVINNTDNNIDVITNSSNNYTLNLASTVDVSNVNLNSLSFYDSTLTTKYLEYPLLYAQPPSNLFMTTGNSGTSAFSLLSSSMKNTDSNFIISSDASNNAILNMSSHQVLNSAYFYQDVSCANLNAASNVICNQINTNDVSTNALYLNGVSYPTTTATNGQVLTYQSGSIIYKTPQQATTLSNTDGNIILNQLLNNYDIDLSSNIHCVDVSSTTIHSQTVYTNDVSSSILHTQTLYSNDVSSTTLHTQTLYSNDVSSTTIQTLNIDTSGTINVHGNMQFNSDTLTLNDIANDSNPITMNYNNLVMYSPAPNQGLTIRGNIFIENQFQNPFDTYPPAVIGGTGYGSLCSDSGGNLLYLPSLPRSTVDCLFQGQDHSTALDTSCNIIVSNGLVTIEWPYGFDLSASRINTSNESGFTATIPLVNAYPLLPNNGDRKTTTGHCICSLKNGTSTIISQYICTFAVGYDTATSQGFLDMEITDQTVNPFTAVLFNYNSNTNYHYSFGDKYSQSGFTISYMI